MAQQILSLVKESGKEGRSGRSILDGRTLLKECVRAVGKAPSQHPLSHSSPDVPETGLHFHSCYAHLLPGSNCGKFDLNLGFCS